ncbi:MAG: ABC-2 family transporter protein [Planctomycetes bacterium]|nr:ABC-2 family transporter protein [Planctomycetota bacterium]
MGLRQHVRIGRQFARMGVARKSQFRVEFASQVLMDIVWYATHVGVFEVLMRHTHSLAGWTLPELRVFVAFLFVSDAFWMAWMGKSWHFGRDLKDGNLDPVRVRPASPIFLYFFQSFSLEACFNGAIALGYLGWALASADGVDALRCLWAVPWAIALSVWARIVVTVLFSTAELYLVNSDLGIFFWEFLLGPIERPLDVFGRRVKLFLLFVVPVGCLTHFPAALVLGRVGALEALGYGAWLLLFGLGVFWFWRRSFRRYESALS